VPNKMEMNAPIINRNTPAIVFKLSDDHEELLHQSFQRDQELRRLRHVQEMIALQEKAAADLAAVASLELTKKRLREAPEVFNTRIARADAEYDIAHMGDQDKARFLVSAKSEHACNCIKSDGNLCLQVKNLCIFAGFSWTNSKPVKNFTVCKRHYSMLASNGIFRARQDATLNRLVSLGLGVLPPAAFDAPSDSESDEYNPASPNTDDVDAALQALNVH